jgi:hypothetical protein
MDSYMCNKVHWSRDVYEWINSVSISIALALLGYAISLILLITYPIIVSLLIGSLVFSIICKSMLIEIGE